MSVFDYFIGTTQSKYASVAIFLAIFVICIAILFTNSDIPLSARIGVVLFVILISIFPVAISLFELTCIVTGGKNTKYNLCNYFAWFVTIMIIIYSFMLIIMVISSMFTYKKAQAKIVVAESSNKISSVDANKIAEKMLKEDFESGDAAVPIRTSTDAVLIEKPMMDAVPISSKPITSNPPPPKRRPIISNPTPPPTNNVISDILSMNNTVSPTPTATNIDRFMPFSPL